MAATSNQNKTITIKSSGSSCTVSPRELDVNVDDTVTISNQTADSVALLIAEETLFKDYRFDISAGGETTMTVGDIAAGAYPYAVFCREIDGFAQASSMPIIVVRR